MCMVSLLHGACLLDLPAAISAATSGRVLIKAARWRYARRLVPSELPRTRLGTKAVPGRANKGGGNLQLTRDSVVKAQLNQILQTAYWTYRLLGAGLQKHQPWRRLRTNVRGAFADLHRRFIVSLRPPPLVFLKKPEEDAATD
jgi:hypothetical protein